MEHGNPSGIDNYVSVNGGVILYNKNKQPKFKQLHTAAENLKLMSLGVIDTGIEKNTKVAVGIVRERYNQEEASTALHLFRSVKDLVNRQYRRVNCGSA